MKRFCNNFTSVLLGCLVALSTPLLAQTEPRGFYASAYVEASRLGSSTFDEIGNAGLGSGLIANFGSGLGLGGDSGYRYGNGWAAEFEWNWRRHNLKSLNGCGAALATEGDLASQFLFVTGFRRVVGLYVGGVYYAGGG